MKAIVSQENLKKALLLSERATSRTATLPILNNVLMRTENGRLKVSATNLEIGVHCVIGAKIEKEGAIAVPAKTVADFVTSSPAGAIVLSVQDHVLTLKSETYKTTVLGFDTAEYPIIPKVTGDTVATMNPEILKRSLASVVDASAVSENRPELAGVYIAFSDGKTVFAATDSFRLAERSGVSKKGRQETVIIPRATAMEVIRLCDQNIGDIAVRIADNQISFSGEDAEVVSRLVDGTYPDYRKIIPEKAVTRVLVSRKDMEDAVRLTSVFSSNISDIQLLCKEGTLSFSAKNSAKGDALVSASANVKGDDFELTVNHYYLSDGLKSVPGDEIVLEYTGTGSPLVIRMAEEPKDALYLVMPLRR